jgi:hypothetical protein
MNNSTNRKAKGIKLMIKEMFEGIDFIISYATSISSFEVKRYSIKLAIKIPEIKNAVNKNIHSSLFPLYAC